MSGVMFSAPDLRLRDHAEWTDIENTTLQMLYQALDHGGIIAFAGAGTSMDYAFPPWEQLAKCVVEEVLGHHPLKVRLTGIEWEYLQYALKLLAPGGNLVGRDPGHLMGILNYCHRIYVRRQSERRFGEIVESAMKAARNERLEKEATVFDGLTGKPTWEWEPGGGTTTIKAMTTIKALIDILRIRRFITTNYESLIEERLGPILVQEGLVTQNPLVPEHLPNMAGGSPGRSPAEDCPSIDRLAANPSDLMAFAMEGGNGSYGVVHLHGRMPAASLSADRSVLRADYLTQPAIVLTESQYQQHYESNRPDARDRRDAYELLLQANSLLFVGASLDDEDALRPLRRFVADYDVASYRRPWFALLSGEAMRPVEKVHKFHQLYFRYGISSIFTSSASCAGWPAKPFVDLINHVSAGWAQHRAGRDRLPAMRRPVFSKRRGSTPSPVFMAHHANEYPIDLGPKREAAILAIKRLLGPEGSGAVLVLGRQGSGKGSFGYAFSRPDFEHEDQAIRFYGTTLFANEFMTLIDGAANHIRRQRPSLPADPLPGESRVATLFRLIRTCPDNVIIVLVPNHQTLSTSCVKSHQIIAGMMTAWVSRPAAAVAARPALVR